MATWHEYLNTEGTPPQLRIRLNLERKRLLRQMCSF